jgi:CRISPR system Cascade subunit CasA
MSDDCNLWTDPWIRVLQPNGERAELSIRDTLLRAHELRALYDPSPLTVAGVHRLLTAIAQWIYAPESLREIADVLEAGRFDAERIADFGGAFAQRFGLFDPVAPFLQTADAPAQPGKEVKTVASLLAEAPSGTNRAHFHHVTDDSHRFCPACCARALVTMPAFAAAAGRPYRPGINGTPPIYALPSGGTIFESLVRSLTAPDYQPAMADRFREQAAIWTGQPVVPRCGDVPDVGYIESFTLPARRIRFYPVVGLTQCTHCGAHTMISVSDIHFDMGVSRPKEFEIWRDPFVALRVASTKQIITMKPQADRALWREYSALLLGAADLRPTILNQMSAMIDDAYLDRDALIHFRCIGMRTDQAKNLEWFDETLDVPPALLRDPAGAQHVREALERAEKLASELSGAFAAAFRPHKEREWFKTLRERMLAGYWSQLAAPFRTLVGDTTEPAGYDDLRRSWAETLLNTGRVVARDTLRQVGDGADLLIRRVRAEDRIAKRLGMYRKEWLRDG